MEQRNYKMQQEMKQLRPKAFRKFLKGFLSFSLRSLCEIQVIGEENIPVNGPLIVVGNHFCWLDPIAVIAVFPWYPEFMGGTQLPSAPVVVRSLPKLWA